MTALAELYFLFFKIAAVTFGGGYAMIPLFQDELVVRHQTLTGLSTADFANMVALAQMTPGPVGLNAATYVGYQVGLQHTGAAWGGILYSAVATFAIVSPSLLVTMLVAMFLRRFSKSRVLAAALGGIRPAVLGMIAAAVVFFADTSLWQTPLRTWWTTTGQFPSINPVCCGIFLGTLALRTFRRKLGIFPVLLLAGAAGWLFG